MKKFKIFTTIFILYEFVMITILQIHGFCIGLFNQNFCETNYKYFLFSVMLPILFGLVFWWVPKRAVEKEKTFKDILKDSVPKQYLQRLVIAVIIVAVRKFSANYHGVKKFFDDIDDILKNNNLTK